MNTRKPLAVVMSRAVRTRLAAEAHEEVQLDRCMESLILYARMRLIKFQRDEKRRSA